MVVLYINGPIIFILLYAYSQTVFTDSYSTSCEALLRFRDVGAEGG